jgi:outer membrane protein assembly factor BamB
LKKRNERKEPLSKKKFYLVVFISLFSLTWITTLAGRVNASDWPQWRGPQRDGKIQETGLLKTWPEQGPKILWSIDGLGRGHSSPSVKDNIVYATGMIDRTDYLQAIDPKGKILWKVPFGRGWFEAEKGVRSTPTIEGERIYVISGMGEISCIDASKAEAVWTVPAFERFQGEYGQWGIAESLLLVDEKVIYTPAGKETAMVALDKNSGETIWKSESLPDYTGYASPILIHWGGREVIANVTANYIFGVDSRNGKILWKYRYSDLDTPTWHPDAPIINIPTPLFHQGNLYVTSGYDHVGVMFRLSADASDIEFVWKDATLDCHHGGVVLVDGYIYGSNWIDNARGNWACVEWKTGKTMYEKKWQTKGSIIYADERLYCYEERRGIVALVKPDPEDFAIVSQFRVEAGVGPHWAHPAISNGILYIRHGDMLTAYDIRDPMM